MNGDLVENVRYGHGLGWSFTPLAGKRPTQKGWQSAPRETLEQAMAWASQGNVGLRTGRISGMVAIDADPGADLTPLGLPDTVTALTGRPVARHLYFHHGGPLGNSSGKLGPHIDVKADGGQVVFPGSVHPDTGVVYAWAEGREPWAIEVAELPEHIVELLRSADRPEQAAATPRLPAGVKRAAGPASDPSAGENAPKGRAARPAVSRAERYATQAMRLELNAVHAAGDGNRNDTLNRAAFSLGTLIGGGCLDRQQVEDALQQAGLAVGLGQSEVEATIRSGIESGVQHPRQPGSPLDAGNVPAQAPAPLPSLPPGRFALDLYGNADRFMHLFGRDVRWCEDRGRWYVWDGRCWMADATREVFAHAEQVMRAVGQESADGEVAKWAARCNRGQTPAREMLEVVKHRAAIRLAALDADRWLLGVQNGAIDLRTGELLPHDREQYITALCPSDYDPQASCERWEQFLVEIMAGDTAMITALQRFAGYCLTGDISVQILPIFYGPGGNGKNVFLDTLMGLLGPHAEEAPDSLITVRQGDEHPTEIADLYGKRLIVASETEEGRKMRIGLVKRLTGNKFLKGRYMRQDYFQFERTHKTLLVTNNKPVVTETSNAIWRRLRLIPFAVTIPEERQDRRLTEKLVAEWPGILAWAVRGCLDWQGRQCDLEFPQAVREATEEYRNDSDHVADFVSESCEDWRKFPEQNMRSPKERVYLAYVNWCRSIGEDILSRNAFNARMRGHGFEDKAAKLQGQSKAQKCWMHLSLRGQHDQQ